MPTFQTRERDDTMLQVEEAQQRVLAEVTPLEAEDVPLYEALGRVLAEDVAANRDVPQADNTAMDGYAVRASDVETASGNREVTLAVVEDLPAGRVATKAVGAGEAIRIMTGAPMPEGADAVVPVEMTDAGSEQVTVHRGVRAGANIRRRGEDMMSGSIVLPRGSRIGAAELGVLATVQKPVVSVSRRPEIAVLSTGDEVIDLSASPEPGKVVNSNSWSLSALVTEAGAIPRPMGIVPDDSDATIRAIESAASSDMIISSGGVSAGAYDFVKDALDALGAETKFWQVAMKPGRPIVLSKVRGKLYFGLPGNPVSCMVSFLLFIGPAIRTAMGQTAEIFPPTVMVRLSEGLKSRGDRRAYQRVKVVSRDGALVALPMRAQGSGVSTSMVGANGFAVMDAGVTFAEAGSMIPAVLFGPVASEV